MLWFIRNVYLVFILLPGTQLLKPWNFLIDEPWKWESFVTHNKPLSTPPEFVLMTWLLERPGITTGWGLVAQRTKWLEGWNFQHHPLGRGDRLEIESIANGQWFNLMLCNKASIRTPNNGFWRASEKLAGRPTGQGHGSSALLPISLALFVSSIWLFTYILWNIVCNKLAGISKVFSWVLWATLPNNWTQGGGDGNPIYSQLVISPGDSLDLWLASEVGAVLWDWALACGIWCYLQLDGVRIELNCRTLS